MRAIWLGSLAVVLGACDPQQASWGLGRITSMQTPADDPSLGCGAQLPSDDSGSKRQQCTFGPGALAGETLGIDARSAAQLPIRHIVVMMRENRSFDHLLGHLHERGQPDAEATPSDFSNLDEAGAAVTPFDADTTCFAEDPGHQSKAMRDGVNGGAMNGFVRSAAATTGTDGHFVMSRYDEPQLPFYYFLAKTFALNDRHFASMNSGTYANRNFLLLGDNAGVVDTGIVYPNPASTTLLHTLMNAGFTWGVYGDELAFDGTLNFHTGDPGFHSMAELLDAFDKGTLPNVVFVDGVDSVDDDHPPADVQKGEAAVHTLYTHAINSPQWPHLAVIWTYDEAGGYADHVPPGQACAAFDGSPFVDRGPRVPLVAISPWAKRHFVAHVAQDHTAITRFIETVFQLPALTKRDANSSALLELFDFSCGRDLSVPVAPMPATGGCASAK